MAIGSNQVPYTAFLKPVLTWSPREKKVRVCRFVWSRLGGPANAGKGWTASLSLNLVPKLLAWSREHSDFRLAIMGVQVHYRRSHGGWLA